VRLGGLRTVLGEEMTEAVGRVGMTGRFVDDQLRRLDRPGEPGVDPRDLLGKALGELRDQVDRKANARSSTGGSTKRRRGRLSAAASGYRPDAGRAIRRASLPCRSNGAPSVGGRELVGDDPIRNVGRAQRRRLRSHTPIVEQPLWDAVQAQLAANTAERNSRTRTRQPTLLAGMLFVPACGYKGLQAVALPEIPRQARANFRAEFVSRSSHGAALISARHPPQ